MQEGVWQGPGGKGSGHGCSLKACGAATEGTRSYGSDKGGELDCPEPGRDAGGVREHSSRGKRGRGGGGGEEEPLPVARQQI